MRTPSGVAVALLIVTSGCGVGGTWFGSNGAWGAGLPGAGAGSVASVTSPGFAVAASLAVPRGMHTATLLADGRVLLCGGLSTGASGPAFTLESEVYDPLAATFTKTSDPALGGPSGGYMTFAEPGSTAAPVQVSRVLHAAVLLADGRVLICGGYGVEKTGSDGQPATTDLECAHVFDPTTNAFTAVGSLAQARSSPSAVVLPDGRVLVAGGNADMLQFGGSSAKAELFDPTTNTFSTSGSMTAPRQLMSGALVGGEALVVGGLSNSDVSGVTPAVAALAGGSDLFDAESGTFAAGPKPSVDRMMATFDALASGDAILAGGEGQGQTSVLGIERLSNGVFGVVAELPGPRSNHASDHSGNAVLLAGGIAVSSPTTFTTLATADFFDGSSNSVTSFPMAYQRNSCAVTALPSGQFLVTGGFANGTTDPRGADGSAVAPAEIFTQP
jgi:hypothetical protein